ncbi:hypothetical protein [Bacillus cereus]|uniref:hypothetical protein n=1 Tax=Bacillus cereus TaxID=1396 RepID=UPI000BF721E1|nr:hypothetical protein [Bacillus cereus]PEZ62962.1 hypothetical protein CN370_07905 [Bacillus cereus]PFK68248.1 hypothetical protein COJ25_17070 [Bacillus cereus]
MRLIYDNDTPKNFLYPAYGLVEKGFIVDVLDKELISSLKEKGFKKAPPFKGKDKEEKIDG